MKGAWWQDRRPARAWFDDSKPRIDKTATEYKRGYLDAFYEVIEVSKGVEAARDEIDETLEGSGWSGSDSERVVKTIDRHLGRMTDLVVLKKVIRLAGMADYEDRILRNVIDRMYPPAVPKSITQHGFNRSMTQHLQAISDREEQG